MLLKRRSTRVLVRILVLLLVIYAANIGKIIFFPHNLPTPIYQLTIEKSYNMRAVARQLATQELIEYPKVFMILARLIGKDKKVTAGLYMLKHPISMWGILQRITNGHPDQISITILEGWNLKQLRKYIDNLTTIKHLTKNMSDESLKAAFKITAPTLEGLVYPSTYYIEPNHTDLEIYRVAISLMQDKLVKLWQLKSINAYYTNPYQMLIMASLIQKETSNESDMYKVSTVFNNRLRIGMKLQDDPAVFYGLGNRPIITRKDFAVDTPYNTYLHAGLPLTPICIPSQKALTAAANPDSDRTLLYFIAIGGGRSKFTHTFNEHAEAVSKYLRKNKKGSVK